MEVISIRLDSQGAFTRASYRAFWSCIGRLRPQHEQQSKLSCQNIVHYFTSRFSISEQHFSEECFNSFLVCLSTITGLRLSIGHLLLQDSVSTFLSVRLLPCIPANIWNSSGHLKWAQDNVVNHVGMPSCFTIAITSRMNFFQYGGVPGICLWNKYAWSSQIRRLIEVLKNDDLRTYHFLGKQHCAWVRPKMPEHGGQSFLLWKRSLKCWTLSSTFKDGKMWY